MLQPGTNLQGILKEKLFPEPRLIVFTTEGGRLKEAQGMIVVENEILFEIENFNIVSGLTSLIASYFVFDVSYPKPTTVSNFLLFILMDKVNNDKSVNCQEDSRI